MAYKATPQAQTFANQVCTTALKLSVPLGQAPVEPDVKLLALYILANRVERLLRQNYLANRQPRTASFSNMIAHMKLMAGELQTAYENHLETLMPGFEQMTPEQFQTAVELLFAHETDLPQA